MKILIAEDEGLAAERLRHLVVQCEPAAEVIDIVDSVADTVQFFRAGGSADLLLLDIQLADGKSFEIFDRVSINLPIIFTTAYDQYALHAFKFYSIDYLLKPIQPENLATALEKFKSVSANKTLLPQINALKEMLTKSQQTFRERFIIKSGNKLQFKAVGEVAFFYADGKSAYLIVKKENRKYLIDHTLEELERSLDPKFFFRISRKHIVCIDSIAEVKGLVSGRLEIKLSQPCDHDLTVSRERAHEFKSWLNR